MERYDNVRPQSAIPNWLDYIDEKSQLKRLYYETITSFIVNNVDEVATLAWDFLTGKYQPDLVKAARDLAKKGVGKYIIFGHTHDPLEKKLAKGAKHLNSGTWRKFIEPKGRPSTRMRTVPTYQEGDTQFQNGPADGTGGSIQLLQHRGIAWASEIGIKILGDEVEKGSKLGVPDAFG